MAKQKGIIKLQGRVGDLSFYKTQDGYLAREKGGVDGDRIRRDPAFARTRENGQEFGMAASAGKLVRDAFRPLLMRASDRRVASRLTRVMSEIRKLDTTNTRGARNVATAIADPAAKAKLKGFNFNERAVMSSILYNPFQLDTATGEVTMNGFNPANQIAPPPGATHVSLSSAWGKIDFGGGVHNIEPSNVVNLPLGSSTQNINLTVGQAPTGSGVDVFLLLIEFFQEVNGNQYVLNNGAFNVLSIIEVA